MKALLLTTLVLVTSVTASLGQFNKKNSGAGKLSNSAAGLPLSERVFFGGGGGFNTGVNQFGFRYTYIAISPLVGYRITMPWSAGLQLMYATYRYPQIGTSVSQYGIAPFTQYRFGKLFVYGEFQIISAPNVNNDRRAIYNRLPLGLGFTQPIGTRAAINVVALYDVLYNKATAIFPSPWVLRVYITAGGISF